MEGYPEGYSEETQEEFVYFAIVADGDFTGMIGMGANAGPALMGLRSNPTMVELTPEQVGVVNLGWVYNGETFVEDTPPNS